MPYGAQLVQILNRHIGQAIQHYNHLVEYTHDYAQVPAAIHNRQQVQPGQMLYERKRLVPSTHP
ncbi:hypothetical protein GCM10010965_18700 [Caldalkalibacillus thermarum]|uniref:hypothetical protein n=1 Tax=Caldalkalibacillus thermarum TaxID=296745 RepID=UPI001983E625|nr:hypothetical protein [Caldalkalibacillus thermarum]GGK16849.1 hypothetical protein GCM10010965_07360 [Caldalkalibacillus thermarum]GGK26237.1 hypothetical protein GCM10010965_18700 [Caldalkalibacillus thermarum]